MLPYIHIFGISIPTYGPMAILGILVSFVYLHATNKNKPNGYIHNDDLLHLLLVAIIGAMAGAKLLYLITITPLLIQNWNYIISQPGLLQELLLQGLVFYGGAIGGFAAVFLYCRRYQIPFKTVTGLFAPIIPLFHTFGRIGCFMAGCCWGMKVPWGITYSCAISAPNGIPLLPIQLIEAACNLLLFIFLAVLFRRLADERKWLTLPVYVFCYSIIRFILEFFRGDKVRGVFLFSTSQWISLALLVTLALLYLLRWRKSGHQPETGASSGNKDQTSSQHQPENSGKTPPSL